MFTQRPRSSAASVISAAVHSTSFDSRRDDTEAHARQQMLKYLNHLSSKVECSPDISQSTVVSFSLDKEQTKSVREKQHTSHMRTPVDEPPADK
jgi:hypothetical protein